MSKIEKAYAITDAKISFVSLVDKAANKKQFLITKAEHGSASFASYGRIVNADADSHYITGIVYEPLTEDAHGNYMTEQEITKAAYWFAKNGNQVDVQHSFEPLEKAAVVESYVAPCDMSIGEQAIKKGTWMMTVEVDDPDIFEKVQKGEITGFSMGGVGKYSDTDDPLPEDGVAKAEEQQPAKGMRGLVKKMAAALGFDVVEKGEVADNYTKRSQSDNFWTAFYALNDVLYRYNWANDRWEFASDEETIRDALTDFNNIVTALLTEGQPVAKSLESCAVVKAGKAMTFPDEGSEKAWLIRVTINACHDLRRSVWSRNRTELPENLADSFETPQDNALYAAVFSLPEKYRVVVLLYYYEDYSIQEISEMIQRNPSTIQTQLERARKKLKMQLEQKGGFHYGQTAIQACHGTNSDV